MLAPGVRGCHQSCGQQPSSVAAAAAAAAVLRCV